MYTGTQNASRAEERPGEAPLQGRGQTGGEKLQGLGLHIIKVSIKLWEWGGEGLGKILNN